MKKLICLAGVCASLTASAVPWHSYPYLTIGNSDTLLLGNVNTNYQVSYASFAFGLTNGIGMNVSAGLSSAQSNLLYSAANTNLSVLSAQGSNVIASLSVGSLNPAQSNILSSAVTNTYNVKSFGAYGDAQWANGVYALSNSTTVNVLYGRFVAGDVGSYIGINGAGTNRQMFWTTIASVTAPNQITISSPVVISYNLALSGHIAACPQGYSCVYGHHDDTAAIQAWLNQITNSAGDFYAPAGNYLILGAPQLTNQNNSQLIVPVPGWNNSMTNMARNEIPVLHMTGANNSALWFIDPNGWFNPPPNTTFFISNLQGNNWTGTNLFGASVIDCRGYNFGNAVGNYTGLRGFVWPLNDVQLNIQNMNFFVGYDANCVVLNLFGAGESKIYNTTVVGGAMNAQVTPIPAGTNGWGIVMPSTYSGAAGEVKDIQIWGFYNDLDLGLIRGDYLTLADSLNGFTSCFSGSATKQIMHNVQFSDVQCWMAGSGRGYFDGAGDAWGNGVQPQIDVLDWQTFATGGVYPDWLTNIYSVYDPSNCIYTGYIEYPYVGANASFPATVVQGINGQTAHIGYFSVITDNLQTNTTPMPKVFTGSVSMLNPSNSFAGNGAGLVGVTPTSVPWANIDTANLWTPQVAYNSGTDSTNWYLNYNGGSPIIHNTGIFTAGIQHPTSVARPYIFLGRTLDAQPPGWSVTLLAGSQILFDTANVGGNGYHVYTTTNQVDTYAITYDIGIASASGYLGGAVADIGLSRWKANWWQVDMGTNTPGANIQNLLVNTLQATNVNAGTFTGNGSGVTNIAASSINHAIIQTNFVVGTQYSNSYNTIINIGCLNVDAVEAAVAGSCGTKVSVSGGVGVGYTNIVFNAVTAVAMLFTGGITNALPSIAVPVNGTFLWTDISAGAGNSTKLVGGQISY